MTLSDLLNDLPGPQASIASRIGVHQTTVSAWQRGSSVPPSTRLPSIAAALGIPLADLAAMVARERKNRLAGRGVHGRLSRPKPIRRAAAKGQR